MYRSLYSVNTHCYYTVFHANIDFKKSAGKNSLQISNEVVGFKVRQPQLCFVLVVTALELSFIFDNHSQYTLLDPDQFSFSHCKPNGQLCFVKQCRIKKIVKMLMFLSNIEINISNSIFFL